MDNDYGEMSETKHACHLISESRWNSSPHKGTPSRHIGGHDNIKRGLELIKHKRISQAKSQATSFDRVLTFIADEVSNPRFLLTTGTSGTGKGVDRRESDRDLGVEVRDGGGEGVIDSEFLREFDEELLSSSATGKLIQCCSSTCLLPPTILYDLRSYEKGARKGNMHRLD